VNLETDLVDGVELFALTMGYGNRSAALRRILRDALAEAFPDRFLQTMARHRPEECAVLEFPPPS